MGGNNFSAVQQENLRRRDTNLTAQMKQIQNMKKSLNLTDAKIKVISQKTASELVQCLNTGEITSQEIVTAFCMRAGTIGIQLKLATDTLFDKALQQAKKCDQERKKSHKKNWTFKDGQYDQNKYFPPLFGVPISIKDSFDYEGVPSTIGISSRLQPKTQSSPIIQCFRNSGIIPFVKSNIPQMGMSMQTMNNVWGRSENPWNRTRATGGSSGGQAGLISSNCSPIGIGSDIGGSIRIPSEFCGIFGIKPTSMRISHTYHTDFNNAFEGTSKGVPLCIGPLGKCVDDLAYEMISLYNQKNYESELLDPYCEIKPFNTKQYMESASKQAKYKIGYMKSLLDLEPSRASTRALEESLDLLKKEGHTLVQVKIPNEREILKAFYFLNLSTGAKHYRNLLNGQGPAVQYQRMFKMSELWAPVRALGTFAASYISTRIHYYMATNMGEKTALQVYQMLGNIETYKKQWVKFWKQNKLDFFICPGFGCQAMPHTISKDVTLAAGYTFLWNILDTPTGSVPVTVVREDEQEYESQYRDEITTSLKQAVKGSAGMPVGIQIIGFPMKDQKVLGLMKTLETLINFPQKHQPPPL